MSVTPDLLKLVIGLCIMTLPGLLREFSDTLFRKGGPGVA